MAKWRLLIVLMIVCFQVNALSMCKDSIKINTNCTMVTPTISCSTYNYSIYNLSGSEVEKDALTQLNGSIYYFNFTLQEGKYVINLCDGTTREVHVEYDTGGDNMVLGVLVLSPILLAFLFMFIGYSLGEEHSIVKLFLMLLSILLIFTSWHFGIIAVSELYGMPSLVQAVGQTTYWVGIVFAVIVSYFVITMLIMLFKYIATRKQERFEY